MGGRGRGQEVRDQRPELRPLQNLRHQGPERQYQLGSARGRRRAELSGDVATVARTGRTHDCVGWAAGSRCRHTKSASDAIRARCGWRFESLRAGGEKAIVAHRTGAFGLFSANLLQPLESASCNTLQPRLQPKAIVMSFLSCRAALCASLAIGLSLPGTALAQQQEIRAAKEAEDDPLRRGGIHTRRSPEGADDRRQLSGRPPCQRRA